MPAHRLCWSSVGNNHIAKTGGFESASCRPQYLDFVQSGQALVSWSESSGQRNTERNTGEVYETMRQSIAQEWEDRQDWQP